MNKRIDANPTKEFFVNMITKDIRLKQAIKEMAIELDWSIGKTRNILLSLSREGKIEKMSANTERWIAKI